MAFISRHYSYRSSQYQWLIETIRVRAGLLVLLKITQTKYTLGAKICIAKLFGQTKNVSIHFRDANFRRQNLPSTVSTSLFRKYHSVP